MAPPTTRPRPVLRVGSGGPGGSGKTALMDALCKQLRTRYEIAAATNDIYKRADAEILIHHPALPEGPSVNLAAIDDLCRRFPALDLILVESGGDNLAATFSPELADLTI